MSGEIVIAAAGAGKTTSLIDRTTERERRVLITTYTQRNTEEIRERLILEHRSPPSHVQVRSWYEFLLREILRPYQACLFNLNEIRSINFEARHPRFARREDVRGYYLDRGSRVYSDVASDLACRLIEVSGGLVLRRLEAMYDEVLVDEFQDLAGHDLSLIESLMSSAMKVCVVGDPRQGTYATSRSQKDRAFRKEGLYVWAAKQARKTGAVIVEHNHSYRCCQRVCDVADLLYPELPKTMSRQMDSSDHEGLFFVQLAHVRAYVERYGPSVLRWDRRSNGPRQLGLTARNIGVVKGCSFDRVLVFPTAPMKSFLRTFDPSQAGDRSKLYVAITRARHSVAFVVAPREVKGSSLSFWEPT